MKNSRFTDARLWLCCAAEGGECVPSFAVNWGSAAHVLQMASEVWGHGRLDGVADEGVGGGEPSAEADVHGFELKAELVKEALGKK